MNRGGRALLGLALGLMAGGVSAVDTFRWVDEQGGVHYSDRVPPEEAKNRRAKLNDRGFEVEVVEAPKTLEQIRREQLLKQLREQQEKVLNEQRDQDIALMRTYRNTDEILAALKAKLDSLEGAIKLTQASIQRDRQNLAGLERRAAELAAKGQAVPPSTRESIAILTRRIAHYQNQNQRTENEKLATSDRFKQDLKRFEAIKAMQARNESLHSDWTRSVAQAALNSGADFTISAVECNDREHCDRYWGLARDYLVRKTGYPLSVETDRILQTPYPRNDTDFGITITLIPGRSNWVIFMDVICRPTSIGEQLCKSARVRELHARFRDVMLEAAAPAPGAH